MIAALSCDSSSVFTGLCQWIDGHDPSGVAGPVTAYLLAPILVFVAIIVVGRVIRGVFVHTPAIARDPQVRALTTNVLTAATYVLAVLAALVAAGLSISVLLTFGGLASLAVGLAFQDVLRNLLAGVFLLVEQPFKLGDTISVVDYTGVVQTIQLRTTALKTGDGRLVVVPNLTCFTNAVVNHSAYDERRYSVTVRVPRDRDLAPVIEAAKRILSDHKSVSKMPLPSIVPDVGSEETLLQCRFWLDYRSFDSDVVTADVAAALATLGLKR